jgi:FixJ family two-component response regulator
MRSLGFLTEAFHSAVSFLSSDRRHGTACLIADVQMPGMTGLELHRRLVASGQSIPTILITAYPDARVRARALRAGIKCFLTKPFSEEALLGCIHEALDRSNGDRKC